MGRLFELQSIARRLTATRGQQLNLSHTRISSRLCNSEEQQLISHTTSQYPLKHTETTQEEAAAPGKLPETPLRMDPDLLYDTRYDYEFEVEPTHHIQMETPPKETTSSYSVRCAVPFHEHQNSADVLPTLNSSSRLRAPPSLQAVCRWVEEARERLKRFSSESLPLFFLIMWVVVIGVVGSAVIVRVLDLIFPACEQK